MDYVTDLPVEGDVVIYSIDNFKDAERESDDVSYPFLGMEIIEYSIDNFKDAERESDDATDDPFLGTIDWFGAY